MPAPTSPATAARLIHLALLAGIAFLTAILAFLPPPVPAGGSLALLLYATFGAGATMFAGALLLASRLPLTGPDPDRWWRENLSRAILVWSMVEGPSLLGAVVYYLTRSLQPLLVTGVGLFLLALLSPGWLGKR